MKQKHIDLKQWK